MKGSATKERKAWGGDASSDRQQGRRRISSGGPSRGRGNIKITTTTALTKGNQLGLDYPQDSRKG